jgi:hypothetical protein
VQNRVVTESLILLLVTAFVVFRFAVRELKPRVIKNGPALWLRPLVLVLVTVYVCWAAVKLDPGGIGELVVAVAAGAVVGAITGVLIVRYTTFSPAPIPNAVVASGSRLTFGIWVAVFALRLLARFVVPHGADPLTQLPMNGGTVTVVAVAFLVIAYAFSRAIGRYGTSTAGATQ